MALRLLKLPLFGLLLALTLGSCRTTTDTAKDSGSMVDKTWDAIDGGEVIPVKLRRAYIFNVKNRTFQTGIITQELTRKVKQELEKRGRLLLVDDRKNAHILVYVSLDFYKELPVTYDTIGRPMTIDLIGATTVKVRKHAKGTTEDTSLIDPTKVEARVHYSVRGDGVLSDFQAVNRLTDQLAARIALTVETGWYTELKTDRELGQPRDNEGIIGTIDTGEIDTTQLKRKSEEDEIKEQEAKMLGIEPEETEQ